MFAASLLIAACGGKSTIQPSPVSPLTVNLSGKLLGGQQPVSGARVQIYAAGSTGYGSGAQALGEAIYTDKNGAFSISDNPTCPSSTSQSYILATGGDPGVGSNNPAIALMAALGPCEDISSLAFVSIDEVTTVAAVWALAPFVGAEEQIGASATNQQGLTLAFTNINNLVNLSTGTAPGNAAPSGSVLPVAKLNTLANILAACVNSTGSGVCDSLFKDATPKGGAAPANTIEAALGIARNPSANVAELFAMPTATAPFQPTLSTAPADWTLAITYSGAGLDTPGSIAVDADGNVWAANYFNSASEFSASGTAISPDAKGFRGGGLNESYGIAIDKSGSIWVTNEQTPGVNSGLGSLTVLNSSGEVTSGSSGYFGGGVCFPVAVATDTDGSVWTANFGNSTASKLSSSGTAVSGSRGFGSSKMEGPVAVAIDASHNAWFANQSADAGSLTEISANGSQITVIGSGGEGTSGVATDSVGVSGNVSKGHVWTANYHSNSISEILLKTDGSTSVVSMGYTGGGLETPNGIAVDGAGNVWVANFDDDTLTELEGANGAQPGTPLSPATGLGKDAALSKPYGIAIDASGNVWVSNQGSNTITQFLGAATPVKTPLIGPAQLP